MQVTAALQACDGNVERAADWLFSHMDDLAAAVAAANDTAPLASEIGTSSTDWLLAVSSTVCHNRTCCDIVDLQCCPYAALSLLHSLVLLLMCSLICP